MIETLGLLGVFGLGALLGLLYFCGLWLTVQRLPRTAWWFLASAVLRMAALLGGLFMLGGHDGRRLLAALGGIVLVRVILTSRADVLCTASEATTAPTPPTPPTAAKESRP